MTDLRVVCLNLGINPWQGVTVYEIGICEV